MNRIHPNTKNHDRDNAPVVSHTNETRPNTRQQERKQISISREALSREASLTFVALCGGNEKKILRLEDKDAEILGEETVDFLIERGFLDRWNDGYLYIPASLGPIYQKLYDDNMSKEWMLVALRKVQYNKESLDKIETIYSKIRKCADRVYAHRAKKAKGGREFRAILGHEEAQWQKKMLNIGILFIENCKHAWNESLCFDLLKSNNPASYHKFEAMAEKVSEFKFDLQSGTKCDEKAKLDREFLDDLGIMTTLSRRSTIGNTFYEILRSFKNLPNYITAPTKIPTKIFIEPIKSPGMHHFFRNLLETYSALFFDGVLFDALNYPNTRTKIEKSKAANAKVTAESPISSNMQSAVKTVADLLHHELGHFYHYTRLLEKNSGVLLQEDEDKLNDKFMKLTRKQDDPTQLTPFGEKIKKQISNYALTDAFEFVAEFFLKIMNGTAGDIDEEVRGVYKKFHGPKDPKIKFQKSDNLQDLFKGTL